MLIFWVDKVTKCIPKCKKKKRKSRLSHVNGCALVHIIICGTCWWKQLFFFVGERTVEHHGSLWQTLVIFSHNDWWLPAPFFLCGDSHSSHQRSHSKKLVHFPLLRRVSSVHEFLLTPPHRYQFLSVHFQKVKYTGPDFPSALYGKSLETEQTITVNTQTTIWIWTWYLKKDWKTFIDTRHTHKRNTFQNVNVMRPHWEFQIPKYNNYNK